jgi:hypothetical protein
MKYWLARGHGESRFQGPECCDKLSCMNGFSSQGLLRQFSVFPSFLLTPIRTVQRRTSGARSLLLAPKSDWAQFLHDASDKAQLYGDNY